MILNFNLDIQAKIVKLFIDSDIPLNIQDVSKKIITQGATLRKYIVRLIKKGLIEEINNPSMPLFSAKVPKDILKIAQRKQDSK